MRKQALQLKKQIHNHFLELGILDELQKQDTDVSLRQQTDHLKKIIKAKQGLLQTLRIDYQIDVDGTCEQ